MHWQRVQRLGSIAVAARARGRGRPKASARWLFHFHDVTDCAFPNQPTVFPLSFSVSAQRQSAIKLFCCNWGLSKSISNGLSDPRGRFFLATAQRGLDRSVWGSVNYGSTSFLPALSAQALGVGLACMGLWFALMWMGLAPVPQGRATITLGGDFINCQTKRQQVRGGGSIVRNFGAIQLRIGRRDSTLSTRLGIRID